MDDWRGEHLIRVGPRLDERKAITRSTSSSITAERMRKAGVNPSATRTPWAVAITKAHRRGMIERDKK